MDLLTNRIARVEGAVGVLEHLRDSPYVDRPTVGLDLAGNEPKEGRFSRSTGSDDRFELTTLQHKVKSLEQQMLWRIPKTHPFESHDGVQRTCPLP